MLVFVRDGYVHMNTHASKLSLSVVLIGLIAGSAHADMITISGEGLPAASTAEAAFLAGLVSFTTESFEAPPAARFLGTPISRPVGDFSQEEAGTGGACEPECSDGLAILDAGTTPFGGRFAVDGDQWLDSWDSREMLFVPSGTVDSIGFYLTDPDDAGAITDISLTNGLAVTTDFDSIFGGGLPNGDVYYVSLFAPSGIASLQIFSNNNNDGYGIDSFTAGQVVPEPGTLGLMSAGLLFVVGYTRRRRLHGVRTSPPPQEPD